MRKPSGETLSGEVMAWLQSEYPEIVRGRWRNAVIGAFLMSTRKEGGPRSFHGMVREFRFEPDAYVVNREERFVHFFEVEVFNPMRDSKLDAYGRLAIDFAAYDIDFQVLVVNKYRHINTVNLLPYYARSLAA